MTTYNTISHEIVAEFWNIYSMVNMLGILFFVWCMQVAIDSCCATFAEVQKRGKHFWAEFELYAADVLVALVVDIALVSMLVPYARLGRPSVSKGLLGRIQHACASLPSRLVFALLICNNDQYF